MKLAMGKDNIVTTQNSKRYDLNVPSGNHVSGSRIPTAKPPANITQYKCATPKIRRIDIATGNNVIGLLRKGDFW
jgi:hypothetical protein